MVRPRKAIIGKGSVAMASRQEGSGLATVFGGSGFVGRHVVRALARAGWRVRAAVRRPDLAGHLQPMGVVGQVHAVQANLRYPDSVTRAVQGADLVINAVGVLTPTGRQGFEAVHAAGAEAVAKAAKAAGVAKLVHISALGADAASASFYARSKAHGEQNVLAHVPEAVILRPSIVFGPEDSFFNRFASLAQLAPALPLIGGGRTRFQPVFAGDLAAAVVAVAEGRAVPGRIYEIGGPEVFSFRQLMDRTMEWSGRRRLLVPLPFWLAKLKALATWPLPNSIRPLTVDQVRLLERDSVVSEAAEKEGRTLAGLGITAPHAAGAIVPAYLEHFRPRGQFSHYRS
jgi:NADH dehydrogenase